MVSYSQLGAGLFSKCSNFKHIFFACSVLFTVCLHPQVLCSQAQDYSAKGVLCDATEEGPLRRNPGNHNRNLVERLPTSDDVEFTLSLTNYDTGPMDRSANMSFRNTLEGQISLTTYTNPDCNLPLCTPIFHYHSQSLLLLRYFDSLPVSGHLKCVGCPRFLWLFAVHFEAFELIFAHTVKMNFD